MDLGHDRALFGISVAAELTGVNAQMLRTYEAKGLLEPHRTDGGTRRYSQGDLTRVNRISSSSATGSTWRASPRCWRSRPRLGACRTRSTTSSIDCDASRVSARRLGDLEVTVSTSSTTSSR